MSQHQLQHQFKYPLALTLFTLLLFSNILYSNSTHQQLIDKLVKAALDRPKHFVIYDGAYKKIKYPMGDVSKYRGVCTDVVIRSYRQAGIDLQKELHLDIRSNFNRYPKAWGLSKPDTNIDHRRVPNLRVFFKRQGLSLPVSKDPNDYKPGDLVTWKLANNLPHIGIVVNKKSKDNKRPLIVHNIGLGPVLEDMLFNYRITGHYRYFGPIKK